MRDRFEWSPGQPSPPVWRGVRAEPAVFNYTGLFAGGRALLFTLHDGYAVWVFCDRRDLLEGVA